jgi:cytochrome c oxidase accessory protein FixG
MSIPVPPPAEAAESADPSPQVREVNWQDFREHLATADKDGNRTWVYAKQPSGVWYSRRTVFAWLLIAIMFAGPFIRIDGNPLLMINILERKFSILGRIFWPEDTIIFAVAMLTFFGGIMIFTTAFGRLWCGWACPQTVMMEMVFRKLDYLIEGDSQAQRALDAAPWTASKIARKLFKHAIFFSLSFLIGNTLLSYIIGLDQLKVIITDNPMDHLAGLGFMIAFTLLFYGIFARFREQACTFICPYGRFQSALLDENSMIVAYDHKRGEQRAPWKREQVIELRREEGHGDCVSCRQCVTVCPTGIDIRNGLQMECVNCTACIDACDTVMAKIGRPKGLIRYASLNGIEHGQPLRFTARMKLYATMLTGLIALFLVLVFTRAEVETLFLRAPGALFQAAPDGRISNLYTAKVVNKTNRDLPLQFRLLNSGGKVVVLGAITFVAPKEKVTQTSILIELGPEDRKGPTTKLEVGVYSGDKLLETIDTAFIGPR